MGQRRGIKPKPSVRQQRAIAGFIAVIRGGENKSLVQVLRDAGYAPETAKQWSNVMEGLRPHLQPTLDWMELHRVRVMARMDAMLEFADYADLTRSLHVITKNHQLLGGKPTERFALPQDDRSKLDALIDD